MFITTAEWHRGCRRGPQAEAFSSVASPYPRLLAMRPSLSLLPSSLDHLTSAITSYHPDIVITLRSSWKNHRPIPRHHVSTTAANVGSKAAKKQNLSVKESGKEFMHIESTGVIYVQYIRDRRVGEWVGGRKRVNQHGAVTV